MKYIKETGETHSKLLYHAWSRWSARRSHYTMHGPGGPREEVVSQCMVQVVREKKSLHNALSRWSVGRNRYTMPCPGGPWEEVVTQCPVQMVHAKKPYTMHGPGGPREFRFIMVVMVSRLGAPMTCILSRLHRHTIIMTCLLYTSEAADE